MVAKFAILVQRLLLSYQLGGIIDMLSGYCDAFCSIDVFHGLAEGILSQAPTEGVDIDSSYLTS